MKKIIYTDLAPKPIGPYNQAVLFDNKYECTLFTSGQIAMDATTGEVIKGTIREETHLVMKHLESILHQANMTFENVVKASIFLSDMENFSEVNLAYASFFNEETAPARETVEVANLPKYVNVEISVIAKSL